MIRNGLATTGILIFQIAWVGWLFAAEYTLPISAVAKSITVPQLVSSANPTIMVGTMTNVVQPTLPDGRLPQYQLKYRERERLNAEQRQSGMLWFESLYGDETIRIQATIRINGKPFTQIRSDRIEELTAQANVSNYDATGNFQPVNGPTELMARYAKATGDPVSADETRWLLANWDAGPELLLLNDPFQWFRADQRPIFELLDRDRDGVIVIDEFDAASESLEQADTNGDEVIDASEITTVAKRRSETSRTFSPRLNWPTTKPDQVDLEIEVYFNHDLASESKIAIVKLSDALQSRVTAIDSVAGVLKLRLGNSPYEFSAVQAGMSDQVSIGAVIDGYPLLPAADPNGDGRITIRERRTFVERLATFDQDRDGRITADESKATMRICFGLGATVHRELVELRRSSVPASIPLHASPEWFNRMDRNQDREISRSEFPGTDEQYQALDFDADQLIDTAEAIRYDATQSK